MIKIQRKDAKMQRRKELTNSLCAFAPLCLCVFLFFCSSFLQATDYAPWYPNALELQGGLDYRFQSYPSIDAPHRNSHAYPFSYPRRNHYSSDDHFLHGSLQLAFSPYAIELETELADTRKRDFDWDHVSLTGRYLWLDDNIGDPISLSTGLTLTRAWREAVNDISSFHHGRNEAVLHIALGKQEIQEASWKTRWMGVVGIGTADRWTPWIFANAAYEWNFCHFQQLRLYCNSLWGCGNHKLYVHDFGGYGRIDHRSIDIGLCYAKELSQYGSVTLAYTRRVYAHNFPDQTNQWILSYNYPFGPEGLYFPLKAYSLFSQ